MVGARWTMAYILQVHHAQGARNLHLFIRRQEQLTAANAITHAQARTQIREQRMLTRDARTDIVRLGTAAAAAWISVLTLQRAVSTLTKSAMKFHYEGRALSAILGEQGSAGAKLYANFERLNPQIREFMPSDVIGRMKMLAQAGYEHNEILRNMSAILDSVTASFGELNLDTAVELGINLDRAFGDANHSMRDLLDTAAQATIQFPMTLGQITSAMGFATEAAVIYGQSLESTLLMLGMLMPVTKTATKAGTAFRRALDSLTRPATIEFMKEQGIAVKDAAGEFREMPDILIDVARALDKMQATDSGDLQMKREQMLQKMFGTRGKAWYAALQRATELPIATGPFAGRRFADFETAILAQQIGIAAGGGALSRLASEVRETSQIIDQKFNASLERTSIVIGSLLLPTIDQWKKTMTSLLDYVAKLIGLEPGKDNWLSPGVGMLFSMVSFVVPIITAIFTAGVFVRLLGRSGLFRGLSQTLFPAALSRTARGIGAQISPGAFGQLYAGMGAPGPSSPRSWYGFQGAGTRPATVMQGLALAAETASILYLLHDATKRAVEGLNEMADRVFKIYTEQPQLIEKATDFLIKYIKKDVTELDIMAAGRTGVLAYATTMRAALEAGMTPQAALDVVIDQAVREVAARYAGEDQREKREALTEQLDALRKGDLAAQLLAAAINLPGISPITKQQAYDVEQRRMLRPPLLPSAHERTLQGEPAELSEVVGGLRLARRRWKKERDVGAFFNLLMVETGAEIASWWWDTYSGADVVAYASSPEMAAALEKKIRLPGWEQQFPMPTEEQILSPDQATRAGAAFAMTTVRAEASRLANENTAANTKKAADVLGEISRGQVETNRLLGELRGSRVLERLVGSPTEVLH